MRQRTDRVRVGNDPFRTTKVSFSLSYPLFNNGQLVGVRGAVVRARSRESREGAALQRLGPRIADANIGVSQRVAEGVGAGTSGRPRKEFASTATVLNRRSTYGSHHVAAALPRAAVLIRRGTTI